MNLKGALEYHEEIVDYFNRRGVSAIFLFRRNLLRRLISLLANSYDKDAKPLNGTHKSHTHSPYEVRPSVPSFSRSLTLQKYCRVYGVKYAFFEG